MTSIHVQDLSKTFGLVAAVDGVTLDIPHGKFVCLLGPSGCGKTTLLRLLAGLEDETSGRILIDDVDQSGILAHRREIGMVFQSLALFPHLTVAENIAYPLKIRGASQERQRAKVAELLALVRLPGVEDRQIHQLSGGQKQRIAIARGLAIDPKLFLLDEPLSALDANLREHMQIELRQLQQKLGVTTVVVTHDQREALTMADIVIVMDRGKVMQAGPPIEIYRRPANAFVAGFIGTSNLIPCRVIAESTVNVMGQTIALDAGGTVTAEIGAAAILSVRPEDVVIAPVVDGAHLTGTVGFIRDLGSSVEISVQVGGSEILAVCSPEGRPDVTVGQTVGLVFHTGRSTVLRS
jgi:putative spermidine/putrescine transport system ATP-binding protein